uniref:Uncharacterized protein n=1 Tax=Cucumis melo TaxID=3656 RepID=A0A9I9EDD9_CUCME
MAVFSDVVTGSMLLNTYTRILANEELGLRPSLSLATLQGPENINERNCIKCTFGNYPNGTYVVSMTWYFFKILEFSCHTALLMLLIGFASCLNLQLKPFHSIEKKIMVTEGPDGSRKSEKEQYDPAKQKTIAHLIKNVL